MTSRTPRFRQTAVVALAMMALLTLPMDALAVCKGLTWVLRSHTGSVDNVGIDSFSNAYQGDTDCTSALPLLCLRKAGLPPPSYISPNFTNGWTGGSIQLTAPRFGYELTSRAAADAFCAGTFGSGWALAEFHDGGGGWGWYAYGSLNTTGRFWVAINDQPANPWDSLATGQIAGRVIDGSPYQRPIPGATVTAGSASTVTDSQGYYTLPNLPLGTYTLRAFKNDWTFGSTQLQNDLYTRTLASAGAQLTVEIKGWNFEPILFVHGWTSDLRSDFSRVRPQFNNAGYYTGRDDNNLDTSIFYTPPFEINALHVRRWIDDARYITGRDKVILYSQSMGGLVARAYLESMMYRGDVSQLFTYGSPHLGVPFVLTATGCLIAPRPDAICEMSGPGMALFNLTHVKRAGVDYHLTAGAAPMWRSTQVCFRIFGRTFCIPGIPVPDFTFRSTQGWAMGLLIPGDDDGFIQTCSASGLPGPNIDRYLTQEIHFPTTLGTRGYHNWDGSFSQQGFAQCSRKVLIDRTTSTCGTRSALPPLSCLGWSWRQRGASRELEADPSTSGLAQGSRPEHGVLRSGEHRVRSLAIEGGATTFSATWGAGSANFTLIDPSGLRIDSKYAASIQAEPDSPDAEMLEAPTPEMVVYAGSATQASYYLPAARPGVWQLLLEGGELAEAGTLFTTQASFNSGLSVGFSSDRQFYAPGGRATLRVSLSERVMGAKAAVRVLRQGGIEEEVVPLNPRGDLEFEASYPVPNAPGYLGFDWSVVGERADGTAFERGGRELVQVQSPALELKDGSLKSYTLERPETEGLHSALAVALQVSSSYADGSLGVFAELADAEGNILSRTNTSITAREGGNFVELRFPAEDIYRARRDGPYFVRNVRLLDQRASPLLSQELALAHTTEGYAYRSFAPAHGTPSVYLDGPFRVRRGEFITLTASGIDPEDDPLEYAWDLGGNGEFEVRGPVVEYTPSKKASPGLRTVRVRVTDPTGQVAVAETSLEILGPTDLPPRREK